MSANAEGYLYLFSSPYGRCKIGISKNPERRLRVFHEAGLFELKIEATWHSKLARTLENNVHKSLAESRVAGEWFAVPAEVAVSVINSIHSRVESGEIQPSRYFKKKHGIGGLADPSPPEMVAKTGNAASIRSRQRAIRSRLSAIQQDWVAGSIPTKVLLDKVGVSYASARNALGPRRRYIRHEQASFFEKQPRTYARAETEKARTQSACRLIADEWKAGIRPTHELLQQAGVSRNTALLYLGKRPSASVLGRKRNRRSTWIGPAFPGRSTGKAGETSD